MSTHPAAPDDGASGSVASGRREATEPRRAARLLTLAAVSSVVPVVLGLLGLDLGFRPPTLARLLELPEEAAIHLALRGAFVHTILEGGAITAALMTALLAWLIARLSTSPATAILALALGSAAVMDTFHVLASDHLVPVALPVAAVVPFSWLLSRVFHSAVLVAATLLYLRRRGEALPEGSGRRWGGVFVALAVVGIAGVLVVPYAPRMLYPDSGLKRPWELLPLVLYLWAGILLLRARRREPGIFLDALLAGLIPAVAVQLHMAFGSAALYDHHFNAAHLLKAVSYALPAFGLAVDYLRAREAEVTATEERTEAETRRREEEHRRRDAEERARALARLTRELERRNEELDRFAYVASHDLKAPLRGIRNLATWIEEDAGGRLEGESREHLALLLQRAEDMEGLIDGLLTYSRAGRVVGDVEDVDVAELAAEIVDVLGARDGVVVEVRPGLPTLRTHALPLRQVLQNLLSNAVRHARSAAVVEAERVDEGWELRVSDDGEGIPPEHHERVFGVFQRLDTTTEGTGIGLAVVEKVVEGQGGTVRITSTPGEGTTFHVVWPDVAPP